MWRTQEAVRKLLRELAVAFGVGRRVAPIGALRRASAERIGRKDTRAWIGKASVEHHRGTSALQMERLLSPCGKDALFFAA